MKIRIDVCVLFVLLAICFFQYRRVASLKSENHLLSTNQKSLMIGMRTFKTKDSLNVAQVSKLNLRLKDVEHMKDSLEYLSKDLGIKLKRLSSVTITTVEGKDTVYIPVKQVLIDSIDCLQIDFNDNYYSMKGLICKDTFSGEIKCKHDITIAESKRYKGWWIFKKLQGIDVSVKVHSRTDTITKLKSIEFRKRKRA